MNLLGCLLGFFLAIIIFVFMAAQSVVSFFARLLGIKPPKWWEGFAMRNSNRANRTDTSASTRQKGEGGAHFKHSGRQYVDFEEIKEESHE